MKQRLSLIGSRPLWTGDEIFAACLRAIRAATRVHEALDERLLLVRRDWFHIGVTMIRRPKVTVPRSCKDPPSRPRIQWIEDRVSPPDGWRRNTPISVAMYSTSCRSGSTTTWLTGYQEDCR